MPGRALSLAGAYNALGTALSAVGDAQETVEAFARSLELYERELGPHHPNVARVLANLGGALTDLGRDEDAMIDLRRAVEIIGPTDRVAPAPLGELGHILTRLGRYEEARTALAQALTTAARNPSIDQGWLARLYALRRRARRHRRQARRSRCAASTRPWISSRVRWVRTTLRAKWPSLCWASRSFTKESRPLRLLPWSAQWPWTMRPSTARNTPPPSPGHSGRRGVIVRGPRSC